MQLDEGKNVVGTNRNKFSHFTAKFGQSFHETFWNAKNRVFSKANQGKKMSANKVVNIETIWTHQAKLKQKIKIFNVAILPIKVENFCNVVKQLLC